MLGVIPFHSYRILAIDSNVRKFHHVLIPSFSYTVSMSLLAVSSSVPQVRPKLRRVFNLEGRDWQARFSCAVTHLHFIHCWMCRNLAETGRSGRFRVSSDAQILTITLLLHNRLLE